MQQSSLRHQHAQDKPNYSTNVMKHAQKDITQLVGAYYNISKRSLLKIGDKNSK